MFFLKYRAIIIVLSELNDTFREYTKINTLRWMDAVDKVYVRTLRFNLN